MSFPRIAATTLYVAQVTPRTRWSFVEVVDSDGNVGVGEATLNGRELVLADTARAIFPLLTGQTLASIDSAALLDAAPTLASAAIVSALDHALWDLRAQAQQLTLAQMLGDVRAARVPVYANINRRTRERTPLGFAQSARHAVSAGHTAIKIAPFDGVELADGADAQTLRALLDEGLARVHATRRAIGPDVALMVDCHWRLDEAAALTLLDELARVDLHWLECPLPETDEALAAITRVRARANTLGIRLAGGEQATNLSSLATLLDAGAYDVIMPDVKYIGGVQKMLDAAALATHHGVEFSPHNPGGPVAHAVSLHICAVASGFQRMESQFDETPLFDGILASDLPRAQQGSVALPATPGHGAALNSQVLCECLFMEMNG